MRAMWEACERLARASQASGSHFRRVWESDVSVEFVGASPEGVGVESLGSL